MSFVVSTSSLSDQELYHQQQQKIVELEQQLQKLKRLDSYPISSSHLIQHLDHTTTRIVRLFFIEKYIHILFFQIPPKCNPILSVQIQKRKRIVLEIKNLISFFSHRNTSATTRKIKTKNS